MNSKRMRLGVVCLALFFACSGKKKSPQESAEEGTQPASVPSKDKKASPSRPPQVAQVLIHESGSPSVDDLDTKALAQIFLHALREGEGWSDADPQREAEVELNIRWDYLEEESATRVVVAVQAELQYLRDSGIPAPSVGMSFESSAEPGSERQELTALLEEAVPRLALELGRWEEMHWASWDYLQNRLQDKELRPSERLWILRVAVHRQFPVSSQLDEALRSSEPMVRDQTIGLAVEHGDPALIDAIVSEVDFQDHVELRVAIEAVSVLGGDDAREFLEFVESGHSDTGIRALAGETLLRIEAKEPQKQ